MKLKLGTILMVFFWSLFMGVTAISIGFGAVFPSMNKIAKPFVCPRGEMEVETQGYNPSPGTTVTTLTWYCVDAVSGEKNELGIFPMALYAGLIYGFILFIVIFLFMFIRSNRSPDANLQTSDSRLEKANASLEQAKQFRAQAEEFREQAAQFRDSAASFRQSTNEAKFSGETLARMKELKELRINNLISESEYEQKRNEILKNL
jgi:uncharacterized membrane-anchored protein YhcB (DUF1043 family)